MARLNGWFVVGLLLLRGGSLCSATPTPTSTPSACALPVYQNKWGLGSSGNGAALDTNGNIYVAERLANLIVAYDPYGNVIRQWSSSTNPTAIALNKGTGDIYVAELNSAQVQQYTSTGSFIRKWTTGTLPNGIAIDQNTGNVLVAPQFLGRIDVYSSAGIFLTSMGSPGTGAGQLSPAGPAPAGIAGVATDSIGNVYVADAGNSRVQVFSSGGTFLRTIGSVGTGPGQFTASPQEIAVDAYGVVYATDPNNNRVEVFANDGTYLRQFGSTGAGNGQLSLPYGIAVNDTGHIFVSESGNNRIQIFACGPIPTPTPTSAPSNICPAGVEVSWALGANLPIAKNGAVATNGTDIFIAGGTSAACTYNPSFYKYNIALNSWTTLTNLPTNRWGCKAAVANNTYFVIGGVVGGCGTPAWSNKNEGFNLITGVWQTYANKPTATEGCGLVELGGLIYAISGSGTSAVEVYDPISNSWSTRTSIPMQVRYSAAVIYQGKIYVLGGGNSSNVPQSIVQVYDPINDSWSSIIAASMPITNYYHAAAAAQDVILVFGGGYPAGIVDVYSYSAFTNSWSTETSLGVATMSADAVSAGGKVYIIGGNTNGSTFLSQNQVGTVACAATLTPTPTITPAYSPTASVPDPGDTPYVYPQPFRCGDHVAVKLKKPGRVKVCMLSSRGNEEARNEYSFGPGINGAKFNCSGMGKGMKFMLVEIEYNDGEKVRLKPVRIAVTQ